MNKINNKYMKHSKHKGITPKSKNKINKKQTKQINSVNYNIHNLI